MPVVDTRLHAAQSSVHARVSLVERRDTPLLVALHGAAYDARYFDAPGASVHAVAEAGGYAMVSVTRPGYPATEDSARHQPDLAASARIVSEAVGDAWNKWGAQRPGIVLLGHSVGAAVAVHVAAAAPSWPLRGIAVSGVGTTPSPDAIRRFAAVPRGTALTVPFALCRPMFYGDDSSLADVSTEALSSLIVPFPAADAIEVNTTWVDDLPVLGPRVRVPVHYTLAADDALWVVSEESLASFAAAFTNAPFVEAQVWPGTGHNIEHHLTGHDYMTQVIDFAIRVAGAP